MSSHSSNRDKVVTSIARPIAHPDRYRKQFWMAGTFVVLAVFTYLFLGLLPLVVLLVIGAFATRFAVRGGRSPRRGRQY